MRITNKQITNTFINNFNKGLNNLNKLSLAVSTGQKFQTASEDPVDSIKSMIVRKDLQRNTLYKNNIGEVSSSLTEVETGVSEINNILTDAATQIVQGESDTNSSDRTTIAETLKNYQSEILNIANTKYSSKYIFGGSNTTDIPFTIGTDGTLNYQGVDVNSDTAFGAQSVYCDVGLGLQTDDSGNIIEGTAFDISNPGNELLGTGTDSNGITNNIYNLLGKIANMFENDDMTNIKEYASKLDDLKDQIIVKYADVGQKSSFIKFLSDRYDTTETNLDTKQNDIEGVDSARATVEYTAQQTAYNAALQMGANILQKSLLDYMS